MLTPFFFLFFGSSNLRTVQLLSPTQDDALTVLRTFLLYLLPAGMEVILAQTNRVPEPLVENYVVMTPIRRDRIETNFDTFTDVAFTGSIASDVLTVTEMLAGEIQLESTLFGTDVAATTKIIEALTGDGGVGTYRVSVAQAVASSKLSAGLGAYLQPTKFLVQLDVHGPASADNAQIITTMIRDDFATTFFADLNIDVTPLHADDARQLPFNNGEQQIEDRWVIYVEIQCNQTVTLPQQFADQLEVELIDVDATYPIS